MREKYETLSLAVLRELAKARGLRSISGLRKPELIDRMVEEDEKDAAAAGGTPQGEPDAADGTPAPLTEEAPVLQDAQIRTAGEPERAGSAARGAEQGRQDESRARL